MSFLAPLYLLGAIAVIAPILWHLVRRRPQNHMPFSSLMFLRPSPPKITRRSRLDNWPLLLMRVLALLLLALAFARPLFRGAEESTTATEGRRVVLLVDTSASMRREGLWAAAKTKAREIVDELLLTDSLAVITFDDSATLRMSFDDSIRVAPQTRGAEVNRLLSLIEPTWFATNLGAALSYATDYSQEHVAPASTEHPSASAAIPTQVFLVSDMQSGSDIATLQAYTWPDDSKLEVARVETNKTNNASLRILSEDVIPGDDEASVRVRVSNAVGGSSSSLSLVWNQRGSQVEPIQVPPGESRVVRMKPAEGTTTSLRIAGDDHDFDNEWFIVQPQLRKSTVVYVGQEVENKRDSLLYYLQQIPLSSRHHEVTLQRQDSESLVAGLDLKNVPLVIVGESILQDRVSWLKQYVSAGGRLLWVLDDDQVPNELTAGLRELADAPELVISEAAVKDYAMFAKIDFAHELLAPLADPRFNDFSKIRTWSHRQIKSVPETWKSVIAFDDKDPALTEVVIGDGRLWVLAMGWRPSQSQLALSTKFIPLVLGMAKSRDASRDDTPLYFVGDPVPRDLIAADQADSSDETDNASGKATAIGSPEWMTADKRFSQPGVYRLAERSFAVNVAPQESETDVLPLESLERFGVTTGTSETPDQAATRQRKVQDTELERRQSLWQWAIVAVLGLVGLESLFSGLRSRR